MPELHRRAGYGPPMGRSADTVNQNLLQRRGEIETQWRRFRNGQPLIQADCLGEEMIASWERSAAHINTYQLHAPVEVPAVSDGEWQDSLICRAARQAQPAITHLAEEGDLMAAIADNQGRLIWTFAGNAMRDCAEKINFTAGSCWQERSMGTNAIGLSLQLQRPVTVFACEHFQPFMHDWVSYAAPILYPQSGECAGVFSLTSAWHRHTPLGQAGVTELARTIAKGLPRSRPKAELEIYALGQPRVVFRGEELRLPLRQIEILCLLALNTRGLNLEAFHAALYGDAPVSASTLKAELSHLRRLLDRQIGSRPYRLQVPVWADFIEIWQVLRRKRAGEAFSLYRGSLLPPSESPELEEWRRCIDAVMSQTLGNCADPIVLMSKLCHGSPGSELVRERLGELMLSPDR
jgi:hypothetical protein